MSSDDRTDEATKAQPAADHSSTECYEIRVRGHLGARWAAWFDGLALANEDDGTTVISGPVVDQAALHGLLQKLRDLGITLLSLTRTTPVESIEHTVSPHTPNRPNPPGAPS